MSSNRAKQKSGSKPKWTGKSLFSIRRDTNCNPRELTYQILGGEKDVSLCVTHSCNWIDECMVFDFLCCVNGWFSLRYCICFLSQTTVFVAPAAPADLGFSHPFDVNRFASYGFGRAKKNLKSKREDSHLTYDLWIFKGCTITTLIRWRQSCLVSQFSGTARKKLNGSAGYLA